MSVSNIAGLYGVSVHTDADAGEVVVGGITGQNVSMGSDVVSKVTSGDVYARYQAIKSQQPSASVTSEKIAEAIDTFSLLGKKILSAVNPGVRLFAYFWADLSTRKTGNNHRTYTINEGLIVPRSISCQHGEDAAFACDFLPITDGTNDPIVEADGVAVSTAPADDERFTIGKITIESIVIDQVTSLQIDLGVNARLIAADSDIFATWGGIATIEPMIRIGGVDPKLLAAAKIPRAGQAATHANTSIYLRKRTEGASGFVSNVTAEHIKFTAAGLAYVEEAQTDEGGSTLVMPLRYDGTNDPITVDTTSAIT